MNIINPVNHNSHHVTPGCPCPQRSLPALSPATSTGLRCRATPHPLSLGVRLGAMDVAPSPAVPEALLRTGQCKNPDTPHGFQASAAHLQSDGGHCSRPAPAPGTMHTCGGQTHGTIQPVPSCRVPSSPSSQADSRVMIWLTHSSALSTTQSTATHCCSRSNWSQGRSSPMGAACRAPWTPPHTET